MEVAKRTKIAGGVLVLGLIALGVDRFGGPAAASATTDAAGATTPPAPAKPADATPREAAPQNRGALADRLEQLRPAPGPISHLDASLAPPDWFPAPKTPVSEAPKAAEPSKVLHHLTALMKISGSTVAMVDRHQLVLGGGERSEFKVLNTDGSSTTVRLVGVDDKARTATISVDGQTIELKLEQRSREGRSDDSTK